MHRCSSGENNSEQGEGVDLIFMEKRIKQAHTKAAEGVRKDRKSGTGMSGEPKKGGHGCKFTWWEDEAALRRLQMEGEQLPVDPKDPNYEDPEDDDC